MKREFFHIGINSFHLKCLGLLFMTMDHIAAYGIMSPIGSHPFRIFGRIAAPLFLYLVVISAHHTRSKVRLAIRLYMAHVIIGFLTLFFTTIGRDYFGSHAQFSILPTFAYTVWFAYIIENLIGSVRKRKVRKVLLYSMLGAGSVVIPVIPLLFLSRYTGIYSIIVPDILTIPYSPIFVIMGICWYFTKSKKWQALTLFIFSFLSVAGSHIIRRSSVWIFMDFFSSGQFWMILFFLFIFAYNGERGKPAKWFFYVYYPLHVFILMYIGQTLH